MKPASLSPAVPPPAAFERRGAVRGAAWSGVESAAGAAVGLLLTPLVVARTGVEGLGLWAAAWSLAHAATLVDLGVGGAYARFTARAIADSDTDGLNRTVAAGMGFHLTVSLLVGLAALAAAPWALARLAAPGPLGRAAPQVLGCALLAVLLRLTLSANRGVLAGAQRTDLLGRIGALVSILEGCGAAAVLIAGHGLRGMAINSLAAAAVACGAEWRAARRAWPGLRLRPFRAGPSDWTAILSFGAKVQATRAAEILAAHAPRLALALGPGLLAAGAYDLGARIAGALGLAGALPLPVVLPLASRLEARGDRARLRLLLERATRYAALAALPCLALILLDAPALLAAWTGGPAPAGAAASARLLASAVALAVIASPLRLVVRGIGRPGLEAVASASASGVTLILALLLAGPLGAAGAAAGALFGSIAGAAVLAGGARRAAGDLIQGTARRALSGAACGGAAGLLAGAALRALADLPEPVARGAALIRLLPEAGALLLACAGAAILAGSVRREDLALLRDLVPTGWGGRP
jgi:O-antigen/teichoic acid export membrane protein